MGARDKSQAVIDLLLAGNVSYDHFRKMDDQGF
jgi:hypothetical protein